MFVAEHGAAAAPTGLLSVGTTQTALGFTTADLTGTYFGAADYNITGVTDPDGQATVVVTSDGTGNKPSAGSKTLSAAGVWQ